MPNAFPAPPRSALLLLGACFTLAAAAGRWEHFSNFTEVTSLADDGKRIWLGTQGGLIRIGKSAAETTYFNQANSVLTDARIRNVAADGRGRMAAATYGGQLALCEGGVWGGSEAIPSLRGQDAFDVAWDRLGSLWVLAVDRQTGRPSVFRRGNGQWTRTYLQGVDSMSVSSWPYNYSHYSDYDDPIRRPRLQADAQGRAWVTAWPKYHFKAFRIDAEGTVATLAMPDSLYPLQLVVPDTGASLWLCRNAFAWAVPGGWDSVGLPSGIHGGSAGIHPRHILARAADGSELWSFGASGLYRRRGDLWEKMPFPRDSSSLSIDPPLLLAPVPGNGTPAEVPEAYAAQGNRFSVLAGGEWSHAQVGRTSLRSIVSLGVRAGGPHMDRVVLGSSFGIDAFDPAAGRFLPVNPGPAWGSRYLCSLFPDREGNTWITGFDGPGFMATGATEALLPPDGIWGAFPGRATNVQDFMAEDAAGTLWIADSSRLLSIPRGSADNQAWGVHSLPLPWGKSAKIFAVSAHPDGSIWVAASVLSDAWVDRAARFDGKAWTVFDSLPASGIPLDGILDLRCDSAGNAWALYRQGLLQWDGKAWKTHSWSSSPLFGNGVTAITVDARGALWAATAPPGASLLRWEDGWRPVPDAAAKLGTSEIRSMAGDGAGRLWLASAYDGLLVLDPASDPIAVRPPEGRLAGSGASLSRRADGTWRLHLGSGPESGPVLVRILDIRGAAVPDTRMRLTQAAQGEWLWPGPATPLAPGRYVLSVEGPRIGKRAVPFLFTGP